MKYLPILLSLIFFSLFIANKSYANYGAAFAIDFDVIDNVVFDENSAIEDHIFIAAEAFATFYDDGIVNYNYGFKGNLGYKILGVELYGLGGVQNINISSQAKYVDNYFQTTRTPIYGFGVGYDIPFGPKVRFENIYFELDHRGTGQVESFDRSSINVVFGF